MAGDRILRSLGRGALGQLDASAGAFVLLGRALRGAGALASPPVRTVFFRQVYFTGLQALARTGLIGALTGIVILTQAASLVGKNAALGGQVLVWAVMREIGPLFAAIIVISRSSSAIAAELAAMRVNHEMEVLRGLGIDPLRYLIVPRVLGLAASLAALTVWFEAVSVGGGLALSSLIVRLPFLAQLRNIAGALTAGDIGVSLLKSAVFGLIVAATACHQGLQAGSSITEIPQVTTRAVMQGLSLVVVANVLVTVLTAS
jgi:phospholipid/cholesterol/gamma-HCH transport system permease protein